MSRAWRAIVGGLSLTLVLGFVGCVEDSEPLPPAQETPNNDPNNTPNNDPNDMVVAPCVDRPICLDAPAPVYSIADFQPASARFGESYGMEGFEGKVTLVAMLAGWCPYCQAQAIQMEKLQAELLEEGFDVNFVSINATSANNERDQNNLKFLKDEDGEVLLDDNGEPVARCTFPLLQDTEEVGAWDLHEVSKDDFLIYSADGTIVRFLARGGAIETNLSTEAGYQALKEAIIGAF